MRPTDGDNGYWCTFWMFHTINWAELAHSPELGYLYSFAMTLKRMVRPTDSTLLASIRIYAHLHTAHTTSVYYD